MKIIRGSVWMKIKLGNTIGSVSGQDFDCVVNKLLRAMTFKWRARALKEQLYAQLLGWVQGTSQAREQLVQRPDGVEEKTPKIIWLE